MRLLIPLVMLVVSQLFFNLAHASPHAPVNASQHKVDGKTARDDDRRKRRPLKTLPAKKIKASDSTRSRRPPVTKRSQIKKTTVRASSSKTVKASARKSTTAKATLAKKPYGRTRLKKSRLGTSLTVNSPSQPLRLSKAHRARYQKARETAMNKLMGQLGKPYLWGGASPETGFDCSGLVWYAYKDLVKFKIPRTANEMYHLRDAAPVGRGELEKGDLVFFRINGRGTADHVGVYLGGGKFIQSPRTGKDIQVSALGDDYWRQHYVGARRVMTPKTIR